jgi:hypothetical protein
VKWKITESNTYGTVPENLRKRPCFGPRRVLRIRGVRWRQSFEMARTALDLLHDSVRLPLLYLLGGLGQGHENHANFKARTEQPGSPVARLHQSHQQHHLTCLQESWTGNWQDAGCTRLADHYDDLKVEEILTINEEGELVPVPTPGSWESQLGGQEDKQPVAETVTYSGLSTSSIKRCTTPGQESRLKGEAEQHLMERLGKYTKLYGNRTDIYQNCDTQTCKPCPNNCTKVCPTRAFLRPANTTFPIHFPTISNYTLSTMPSNYRATAPYISPPAHPTVSFLPPQVDLASTASSLTLSRRLGQYWPEDLPVFL